MARASATKKNLGSDPEPRRRRKNNAPRDSLRVKGFFRLQIQDPDGTVAGDSGWVQNLITNQGYQLYLTCLLGKSSNSKQVGYLAIGTGGAPVATDTTLAGEIMASTQRLAATFASVASKSAQFTGTFASNNSFITAAVNLSNIGLFATTSTLQMAYESVCLGVAA